MNFIKIPTIENMLLKNLDEKFGISQQEFQGA